MSINIDMELAARSTGKKSWYGRIEYHLYLGFVGFFFLCFVLFLL